MRKSFSLALACGLVLVVATLSHPVLARGGAGGGGGFSHGSPTGPAGNGAAGANSNGRFATDRDKGQERAEDRRSVRGGKHRNAAGAGRDFPEPPRPERLPVQPPR